MTSPQATTRSWLGLAILALPTLVLTMDITILSLAIPHLAEDLGSDSVEVLWISDIYGFMIAGFLIPMGALGDRIGRRRLLVLGAATFALISVVAAFADATWVLIAARAVLGIAGATLMPSTLALISNMFLDPRQRGTAIGIWAASLSGGVALGPLVGGFVLEWAWWGAGFLVAVPVMLVVVVGSRWLLPEFKSPQTGRIAPLSVILSLVTMLALIFAIKHLAGGGAPVPGLVVLLVGLGAGAAFVWHEGRTASPLVDLPLFRSTRFSASLIVLVLCLATIGGVYLLVAVYLQEVSGLGPIPAGLLLLLPALAMTVTSTVAPRVAARLTTGRVLAASLIIGSVGFGVIASVSASRSPAAVIVGLVIIYIAQGPVMALITDLVVGAAPPAKAGSASAISETGTELGLALGIALFGSLAVAVYRRELVIPPSTPDGAADAARSSLTDVPATGLSPGLADELGAAASAAFASGLGVVAAACAVISVLLAVVAWASMREGTQDSGE